MRASLTFLAIFLACAHISDAAVSDTTCPIGTECDAIANSACDSVNCQCNAGYKDTGSACEKVLDGACSVDGDCTADVPNSECTGSSTCSCLSGYGEKAEQCEEVVSDKVCSDGGNECNGITNSACDVPNLKCKCNAGYKQNVNTCDKVLDGACSVDGDCTADVTNSECTGSTCSCLSGYGEKAELCEEVVSDKVCTDGGTECNGITNSACDVPNLKCKCDAGYKQNVNTCDKVLDGACSVGGDCTADVPNSECTASTCSCESGYGEKAELCEEAVSNKACADGGTECDGIANSACDVPNLKCKCNAGYAQNVNTCDKDSAQSISTSGVLLVATLAAIVFLQYMN